MESRAKSEIGVCLVGTEEMGRVWVDTLLNANRRFHARVVAVVGQEQEQAQAFVNEVVAPFYLDDDAQLPQAFTSLEAAFEWDEGVVSTGGTEPVNKVPTRKARIDAVVIASAKNTHFGYALVALKAGKAVFCQTPLAYGIEHVQELIEARDAQGTGNVVLMGLHKRHDPDFMRLKAGLVDGSCGRAELIRVISRYGPPIEVPTEPVPTRELVYNYLYHDLDVLCWLLEGTKGEGEQENLLTPTQLHSTRKSVPAAGVGFLDTVLVVSKHENEEIAMLEWTQGSTYGFDQRLEVFGSKGALHAENSLESNIALSGCYPEGQFLPTSSPFVIHRYQRAYENEMKHFLTLVHEHKRALAGSGKGDNADLQRSVERTSKHLKRVLQVTRLAEVIVKTIEANEIINERVLKGEIKSGDAAEKEADIVIENLEPFPVLKGPDAEALKRQEEIEKERTKEQRPGAPKRLCLVGAGRMGGIRAIDIAQHSGARLAYLVDIDTKRAGDIAAKYGGEVVSQVGDALNKGGIDGVWIAVGTRQHYDVIKRSSAAGLPIYCEKPISLDQNEVVLSYQEAASHNVPLLCGWNRRFDPHFTAVTNKAKNSESFGAVVGITSTSGDYPTPPPEFLIQLGSIFHDLMVHDIDLITHTVGDLPTSVVTVGNTFTAGLKEKNAERKPEERVIDTAVVVLKFARQGIIALLMARRHSPQGYDQRLEILSNKGHLLAAINPLKTTYSIATKTGRQVDSMPFTFEDRYKDSYKAELECFLKVLCDKDGEGGVKKEELESARDVCQRGLEEALGVAYVCDAALKSQQTGGKEIFLCMRK